MKSVCNPELPAGALVAPPHFVLAQIMFKLRRFIALTVVLASFIALASLGGAAPKAKIARHSVLDYFYLLPFVGNTPKTTAERRELLSHPDKHILDLKNDFIEVETDSYPPLQAAVFRYQGAELVAVSVPDYRSDYNAFHLYRLRNGRLQDVTAKELPMPARTNDYLYEVPRYGTTMRVYRIDLENQRRYPAFDLKWRGGKFIPIKP